jgi:tRNA A37 threonylcarbamoyladenosine synthetase subunit TsaC/SUA5/YrdC
MLVEMAKTAKEKTFEVACPDCGAMLKIDAASGSLISHTSAPRKRMFEDLETAAKAMRDQNERKESLFRQSVEAEKNKDDLFEKKFAEALRKAKDAPDEKPLRVFDLD